MEPRLHSLEKRGALPAGSVLVVDDESAVCHVMRLALGRAGYGVVTAESPEAAIAAVREHDCPVAFSDLNLPGTNGLDLCPILKSEHPHTMAYLLTGFAPEGTVAECLAAGASTLLIKPVDLKVLALLAGQALAAASGGALPSGTATPAASDAASFRIGNCPTRESVSGRYSFVSKRRIVRLNE